MSQPFELVKGRSDQRTNQPNRSSACRSYPAIAERDGREVSRTEVPISNASAGGPPDGAGPPSPARDHLFGGGGAWWLANNPAGVGPGRFINALNVSGKLRESVQFEVVAEQYQR